ncbi:MAG TPA: TauD/TfdA family dioxygenase [Burkholderiales bacterium]|jgi:taurine dioxygenase|nr:TauD/TfdA family dioxygenase [Burkholderiales bacterium]
MNARAGITVTPLSPHVGAEIGNVDLTQPLSPGQVNDLKQALAKHGVIFFHDQAIDLEMHRRFAQYFGELHIHVGGEGTASKPDEKYPEARRQHFDAHSKRVSGEVWHTDQSCAAVPPMASILHQRIVPPDGGGDTLFASMYAAYEALSERMKSFLAGLTATHDGAKLFDKGTRTVYPVSSHPVIAVHPWTGKKLLYVNRGQTTFIDGLPREESDAVLGFLFAHIENPEWQMRFRWRANSIAFWDNRCTQHRAIWDYWPNVRSGYRIQIKGTQAPVATG